MSGGLDEEPSKDTFVLDNGTSSTAAENLKEDNKQKISLIHALLAIGALSECLFVLSEFTFLLNSHSELAESFNTLLNYMIEPLWAEIRPQNAYPSEAAKNLQQPKRVPEELKYRDSALILPVPAKIIYVLDPTIKTRNSKIQNIFFYDRIDSQLQTCGSCDSFQEQILPYIRLAGVQIYRDVKLCTKIAKIGKVAIVNSTDPERTRQLWQSFLRSSLLPALSLLDSNPAIVNDIFDLVKEFGTEQRYSLYGEWFVDSYRRIPELKVQYIRTEKETKSLLRRISKTNTKEYGRRLAKVSHSNPCIVLNIALNQIESYDNLVDVVIEASRYFTLLTFDVLVYVLLTLLSNTQKRRLKDDGTSVAHWLQSLSSFTAKIFKRYSHMDASPVAIYVAKQLRNNNAFDLIILRDLINEMAGIRPSSDLSDDQLQGCGGGPCLRVEALSLINERRDISAKAPLRLLHALDKIQLTHALPVLIGQQRSLCVYNVPEEQSLLKLLANLADEVHQVLLQYLEFLSINTEVDVYQSTVPSLTDLVTLSSLEPCVAFMIARPGIAAALHDYTNQAGPDSTAKDISYADASKGLEAEQLEVHQNQGSLTSDDMFDTPMVVDSASSAAHSLALVPPILIDISSSVAMIGPSNLWTHLGHLFYSTFWCLSLYDLVVPKARYEKELDAIRQQTLDVENEKLDSSAWISKTKDSEKLRLLQIAANLAAEQTQQINNAQLMDRMFRSQSHLWFDRSKMTASPESHSEWKATTSEAFLQHCLFPRCLVSPNDASYCVNFILKLRTAAVKHLDLMQVFCSMFGSHLSTTVFSCTEREAENLGRFLGGVLENLNKLSEDEALYDLAPVSESMVDIDTSSIEIQERAMTWSSYNTTWYGQCHRSIWNNVKACFLSKEYMHIRNILIVLERMSIAFPYFKWIGKNIEKEVDSIIATERREDLKIRALGYKAVLKRQQASWREVPVKAGNVISTGEELNISHDDDKKYAIPNAADSQASKIEEDATMSTTGSIKLSTNELTKSDDYNNRGSPDHTAGSNNGLSLVGSTTMDDDATATPEQTLSMTSGLQKEKAKQKAALLSQQLREKQAKVKEMASLEGNKAVSSEASIAEARSPSNTRLSETKARATEDLSRISSRARSPSAARNLKAADAQPVEQLKDSGRPVTPTVRLADQHTSGNNLQPSARHTRTENNPIHRNNAEVPQADRRVVRDVRGNSDRHEYHNGRLNQAEDSRSTYLERDVQPRGQSNSARERRNPRDSGHQENSRATSPQYVSQERPSGQRPDSLRNRVSETSSAVTKTAIEGQEQRNTARAPEFSQTGRRTGTQSRTLASRVESHTAQQDSFAPRNAPDGPRQPTSPGSGRPQRVSGSAASHIPNTSSEHYVHPSRVAASGNTVSISSDSATSQRPPRGAASQRLRPDSELLKGPQQHLSNMPIQLVARSSDSYSRPTRSNATTGHPGSMSLSDDKGVPKSGNTSNRNDRNSSKLMPDLVDTRDTKDSRSFRSSGEPRNGRDDRHNYVESRAGSFSETTFRNDTKEYRLEKDNSRGIGRSERDRAPDRGDRDYRDGNESKRRYANDSREDTRPTKRR